MRSAKQASLRVIQQLLRRIGVRVTQKAVGKSLSRWLPILGRVLVGGYSLMDTRTVGRTAIDIVRSERPITGKAYEQGREDQQTAYSRLHVADAQGRELSVPPN